MKLDLLIVSGYILVIVLVVVVFGLTYLPSTLLWFGIPAVYLSLRQPKLIAKTALFSLAAGVPLAIVFDYLCHRNSVWYVPGTGIRFLSSQVLLDNVVWMVVWVYFVIVFWETFIDRDRAKNRISWRIRYLAGIIAGIGVIFCLLYLFAPELLTIPYFYLWMGAVMVVLPLILAFINRPKMWPKVFRVGVYFAILSLLIELVALILGHWYFSGSQYLMVFNLFNHRLPIEEVVFWWVLGAPGVIAWYEAFADDLK